MYYIAGVPGFFIGILLLVTVKEPPRVGNKSEVSLDIFKLYFYNALRTNI